MTSVVLFTLALALQAPPQTTPTPTPKPMQTPVTQAAAPQGASATAKPGSLVLTVTSEKGDLLPDAIVGVHGAVDRGSTSGVDGTVTVQNLPAGAYRCRITRDGFVMLDKEITIRAGARTATEAVLWAAPKPSPSPSPSPTPTPSPQPTPAVTATGPAGAPRVLSIAELGDQMLRDSQPTVERQLGCSGVTASKLIATRENIGLHRNADTDEVLYVMAGDATLTIGDKDQTVSAGWFGLVPRGTPYSVTRRGRNPVVLLSVQSGKACGGEK